MDIDSRHLLLPKNWHQNIKTAVLHVISLACVAIVHARSIMANSPNARSRLASDLHGSLAEISLLEEELRIKDARMAMIDPHRRPHYRPIERMAILELKAARCWSQAETARRFLLKPTTIASWLKRLDEADSSLVQLREPVNKFPEFVRYAVKRLKTLCPTLGKVKIADMLCRAGLHLGSTTVGRILKEAPRSKPKNPPAASERVVTAKEPNHVWHIDLTVVPTGRGFWVPWLPFALPQCWPFCWWLAVVIDHYSRRGIGFSIFSKRPTSYAIRTFLGKMIIQANAKPNYLISDKDSIFWCEEFKRCCRVNDIHTRYGAAGQHGSIAVVERFIRTLKDEGTRRILIPQRQTDFSWEINSFFVWYNENRPHTTLDGRTPNEVYFQLRPAHRRPRIEPRKNWPRRSPCAGTCALVAGQPGDRFTLQVDFHDGQRHLPIVSLRRAA